MWVHNADELESDDPDYVQVSDGHVHRLIITAAFPDDTGTYICEAYNDFGEADTACELLVLGLFLLVSLLHAFTNVILVFCLVLCLRLNRKTIIVETTGCKREGFSLDMSCCCLGTLLIMYESLC